MANRSPRGLVTEHVSQDQLVQPEHRLRAIDVADRPFLVGEAIPAVCTITDLAKAMRISLATAYRRQGAGQLKAFELTPRVGHPRYSGARLVAWQTRDSDGYINGQFERPRVFGRKRVG